MRGGEGRGGGERGRYWVGAGWGISNKPIGWGDRFLVYTTYIDVFVKRCFKYQLGNWELPRLHAIFRIKSCENEILNGLLFLHIIRKKFKNLKKNLSPAACFLAYPLFSLRKTTTCSAIKNYRNGCKCNNQNLR